MSPEFVKYKMIFDTYLRILRRKEIVKRKLAELWPDPTANKLPFEHGKKIHYVFIQYNLLF